MVHCVGCSWLCLGTPLIEELGVCRVCVHSTSVHVLCMALHVTCLLLLQYSYIAAQCAAQICTDGVLRQHSFLFALLALLCAALKTEQVGSSVVA
jgi:hypothetical protein